ncbi:glutathione S-transferase alpha I-like [Halichoeres trimaculatus]|uniref:glutathione S-transferase alpha I-like n=1 Tax=Halichoeres trimaculatus TaxID=147232 RepID=UPI003D9E8085
MAERVVLTYFDGRGKMESIRWLLTAAGVDFDEVFLTKREDYQQLLDDGSLMFQQVPLVEIDGMKLIQTKAILNYIAEKYNLHGKDLKDRVKINMYSEGLMDLMEMILMLLWTPDEDRETKVKNIKTKTKERYLPVFEKALAGTKYLVGGRMSMADVLLLECSLILEEEFPGIICESSNIKSFQTRMTQIPTFAKFLQPGSKKKPPHDENFKKTVRELFFITVPLRP